MVLSILCIMSGMLTQIMLAIIFFIHEKLLILECFILEDPDSALRFSIYFLLYFFQDCRS